MKLSNETLTVLKNFSAINQGIQFKQGTKLTTVSAGKTVLAQANLKDDFPQDFCVYDLNQFLSVNSLFKDGADLEFDESNVTFKSGRNSVKYRMTAKEMIVTPPEKELNLPSVDVSFTLSKEDFADTLKSASVLQSPHIAVDSDGSKISVVSFNAQDNSAHTNSVQIAEGNGKVFKMVFLTDNLKMIPGSYDVEISSKGLASFKNKNFDIQYWVASESKYSKFEG
jgi:hypothetical protein